MSKLYNVLKTNKMIVSFLFIIAVLLFVFERITYDIYISYVDGYFMYSYLPELLINHDFSFYTKYPMGTALCELPFFLVAHIITIITNPAMADGYTANYHFALSVCGIFYYVIGTTFLYKILEKLYKKESAFITCVLVTLATPLCLYATKYSAFSHIYSYAILAVFIYLVLSIEEKDTFLKDFFLGIFAGWIFLLRNVNVVFVLLYVLLYLGIKKDFIKHIKEIFKPKRLLFNVLGGGIMVALQLIQWKVSTGHFFLNTYSEESFSFWYRPKIYEVLFSDAKGLMIFSPVLIFVIIGFFFMKKQKAGKVFWPVVIICIYELYVDASWWSWWLGGTYSIRCFLDILAVMAIPICAFVDYLIDVIKLEDKVIKIIIIVVSIFIGAVCIFINMAFLRGAINGTISEFLSSWNELKTALLNFF